jgi:hypothetical protein
MPKAKGGQRPTEQEPALRVTREGGRSVLSVNLNRLPTPGLVGFADQCALLPRGYFDEFVFFDSAVGIDSPVVRFVAPVGAVVDGLWRNSQKFYEDVGKLMGHAESSPSPIITSRSAPPPPDPAGTCNIFRISRAGPEGILECFYLSPRTAAVAQAGLQGDRSILPVVAIPTTTVLIYTLLTHLRDTLDERERRTFTTR